MDSKRPQESKFLAEGKRKKAGGSSEERRGERTLHFPSFHFSVAGRLSSTPHFSLSHSLSFILSPSFLHPLPNLPNLTFSPPTSITSSYLLLNLSIAFTPRWRKFVRKTRTTIKHARFLTQRERSTRTYTRHQSWPDLSKEATTALSSTTSPSTPCQVK